MAASLLLGSNRFLEIGGLSGLNRQKEERRWKGVRGSRRPGVGHTRDFRRKLSLSRKKAWQDEVR